MFNPEKVLNLTENEVNTEELEILSLGTDFKLQNGKIILLDTAVSFEKFDYRHRGMAGKPDLHHEKLKLLSDIHRDNRLILP